MLYALAVAQILAGVSRLAQSGLQIKTFLPQTVWVFNLFAFIFLVWWASWEFRDVAWTFPKYAYMLVAPTLLFFACSLLLPGRLVGTEICLADHFFRIRRPFFASYFMAALAVMVDGNLLSDEPLWHGGRYMHLAILGLSAWAFFTTKRTAHTIIAIAMLLAFVALIAVRFWDPR